MSGGGSAACWNGTENERRDAPKKNLLYFGRKSVKRKRELSKGKSTFFARKMALWSPTNYCTASESATAP